MDLRTVIGSVPHEEQRSAKRRRTFTTDFKQHFMSFA